jgi:LysM repeat protein
MKRINVSAVMLLAFAFLLCGCTVRTYKLTRDRVDQDLNYGNRGIIQGNGEQSVSPERKTTRTTRVVEIELSSPFKVQRAGKEEKTTKKVITALPENEKVTGNRGYLTQTSPVKTQDIDESVEESSEELQDYTVQKNDTLQKISQKFYGTTKKWMAIYNFNKDILKSPNSIYPGQVIKVPRVKMQEMPENLK